MHGMGLHTTVLAEEAVSALNIQEQGFYIDATFGRGGHTQAILNKLGVEGHLLVLDRDPEAIATARQLAAQDQRLLVARSQFGQLQEAIETSQQTSQLQRKVDGVLFDLGVSSPQLDDAERGFSFMRDGPLDMRMDSESGQSAADWINTASQQEIADVLYRFGEERHSRRIARAIVNERVEQPITRTLELAEIVKAANPAWERDKHPATRAFQAIRIHINNELGELKAALAAAVNNLVTGGRLVVISFHSLEDRMVKQFISDCAKGDSYPRGLPVTAEQLTPTLKRIGKPVKPTAAEVAANPRARSAVMRVAEKLQSNKVVSV